MDISKEKLSQLNAVEQASVEKRFLGKSYSKIEEELAEEFGDEGFKLATLKNYFSEGGKLFEVYYWYAEKMNTDRYREAKMYWGGLIMNAVAVVSEEMAEGNPRRLDAARMVIESLWGKSVQPFEVKAEIATTDKYANVTIAELERRLAAIRAEKARVLAMEADKIKREGNKNQDGEQNDK